MVLALNTLLEGENGISVGMNVEEAPLCASSEGTSFENSRSLAVVLRDWGFFYGTVRCYLGTGMHL